MYDFKDITFMIHVRIDNEERMRNLKAIMLFYRKHCINVRFFIIEDCPVDESQVDTQDLVNEGCFTEEDRYVHHINEGNYERTLCYNEVAKIDDRPLIASLDTDVIIHPKYMYKAIRHMMQTGLAMVYPYSGKFISIMSLDVKREFEESLDYNTLLKYTPKDWELYHNDGNIEVTHHHSVGGCVFFNREFYLKIGGYNPNFIGWGYEDNEIKYRLTTLGYKHGRIHDDNAWLWHLLHDTDTAKTIRTENPHFNHNRQLSDRIMRMGKEEMQEYVKTLVDE